MKKYLILLLSLLLIACSSKANIQIKRGTYVDNVDAEMYDPCYSVEIEEVNDDSISFYICMVGKNASPIYYTETITAHIQDNQTEVFNWEDSWENSGTGTISWSSEDEIILNMQVVNEGPANRSTLACENLKLTYQSTVEMNQ